MRVVTPTMSQNHELQSDLSDRIGYRRGSPERVQSDTSSFGAGSEAVADVPEMGASSVCGREL